MNLVHALKEINKKKQPKIIAPENSNPRLEELFDMLDRAAKENSVINSSYLCRGIGKTTALATIAYRLQAEKENFRIVIPTQRQDWIYRMSGIDSRNISTVNLRTFKQSLKGLSPSTIIFDEISSENYETLIKEDVLSSKHKVMGFIREK